MKLVDIEPYKGKVIANHLYSGVTKLIEVDSLKEITEKDIVKPYLDKLKKQVSKSCYKALITDDGDIKESKVLAIIDNLLSE